MGHNNDVEFFVLKQTDWPRPEKRQKRNKQFILKLKPEWIETGFEKNRNEQSRRFLKKKKEHVVLKDFAPIMPVLKA
jgi:hypothetical protein